MPGARRAFCGAISILSADSAQGRSRTRG
jgi:hypothetical protein